MPVEYRIDKLAAIVHTQAYGDLTVGEAMEYYDGLKSDPDFEPTYREFFDFSGVGLFTITPSGMRTLAYNYVGWLLEPNQKNNPTGPGYGHHFEWVINN